MTSASISRVDGLSIAYEQIGVYRPRDLLSALIEATGALCALVALRPLAQLRAHLR